MACGFQRARSWDVLGPWQNGEIPLPRAYPFLGRILAPSPPPGLLILSGGLGGPNTKLKTKGQVSQGCQPGPVLGHLVGTLVPQLTEKQPRQGLQAFPFLLPDPTQLFTAWLAVDSCGGQPCRRLHPQGKSQVWQERAARLQARSALVCICVSDVFVFLLHVLLLLSLSLSPHTLPSSATPNFPAPGTHLPARSWRSRSAGPDLSPHPRCLPGPALRPLFRII